MHEWVYFSLIIWNCWDAVLWPGHCELGSGAGDRKSGRYRGHLLIPPCQDAKSSTSSFLIRIKLHWNFNINIKLLYHWTVDRTLSIFEPFVTRTCSDLCVSLHIPWDEPNFSGVFTQFLSSLSHKSSPGQFNSKSPQSRVGIGLGLAL